MNFYPNPDGPINYWLLTSIYDEKPQRNPISKVHFLAYTIPHNRDSGL
jgi:hypothetical protein